MIKLNKVTPRPEGLKIRMAWLALAAALVSCSTNPVTGKRQLHLISQAQEVQIGAQNYLPYQQMEGGTYAVDPALNAYVRNVGQKLAAVSERPTLPYDFVVLNSSVPNAWALPGGKIAVNRGLLTELRSEAELAAVLGHEIVHAAARHTAHAMEKGLLLQAAVIGLGVAVSDHDYADIILAGAGLTAGLVGQKFSRDHERESDLHGIKYMHKAGYDTQAAVELQETFVRLSNEQGGGGFAAGLFSSHPPSVERVENNRKALATFPAGGFRGEKEYQAAVAGIVRAKPAYDKLGQGYKALAAGRTEEALRLAREASAIEPREALFHGLAAKALQKQNKARAALEEAEKAVALNPGYYEFLLLRGQLRQQLNLPGAREDFAASQKLLPTATASSALGKLALQEGDRRGAAQHFRSAASVGTEEGRDAAAALARLQAQDAPDELVDLGASLDSQARLVLQVRNRSGVPLRGLRVAVRDPRSGKASTFALPGTLAPGRVMNLPTGWGPFESVAQARRVTARVAAAQVVAP
jgi:predicted Zn-dependent protease